VIPGMARESLPWGHDDLKRYGVKSGQGPSRSDDGQKKDRAPIGSDLAQARKKPRKKK
jgi:hypothetical protein